MHFGWEGVCVCLFVDWCDRACVRMCMVVYSCKSACCNLEAPAGIFMDRQPFFPSQCFHLPFGIWLPLSVALHSVWNLFPPHSLCESTVDSSSCVFLPHWLQPLPSLSLSFCLCVCNLSSDSRRPSSCQSVLPEVREQKWGTGCWTACRQKKTNKHETREMFGALCEMIKERDCDSFCSIVVNCSLVLKWTSLFIRKLCRLLCAEDAWPKKFAITYLLTDNLKNVDSRYLNSAAPSERNDEMLYSTKQEGGAVLLV